MTKHLKNVHKNGKISGKKAWDCEICRKSWTCQSHLLRHLATHTGEKKFVCELCGNQYFDASGLRKHCKKVHIKKKHQEGHVS
jgi:uncharacterized Zn-finger protein